ncbi:MAG: thioesterase family protein [Chloroflexota bacterium]
MSLPSQTLTILPEWIDHNGHMNVAYYVVAFDIVTDAIYENWGIGLDYPTRFNASVFTLGMNVDYLSELFVNDSIQISTQMLDVDHKRIHYFHQMYNTKTGQIAATNECLCMNVDLETRHSMAFPEQVQKRLDAVLENHRQFPKPDKAGRQLAIRRKG